MASIMQQMKVKNKPSRNSFDMSENVAFTACLGALLPVKHLHLNAGDKVKDVLKFFSRTAPVRSAAYGRIRESFDFFFVPYRLIWRGYEGFFTDGKQRMNDNNNTSYLSETSSVPFFTVYDARNILKSVYAASMDAMKHQEVPDSFPVPPSPNMGFSFYQASRAYDMKRLLEYLGYGKLITFGHNDSYEDSSTFYARQNVPLNALPLLAYHKIYYDFYRNTEWENNQPHMWYFNNTDADSDLSLSVPGGDYINNPHMFDLHFCNYEQDKYLGVLPSSQLGEPSVVSTVSSPSTIGSNRYIVGTDASGLKLASPSSSFKAPVLGTSIDTSFSILALRQSSAMQKWKEISQFSPMDYKHQISAHYGFNIDDGRSGLVQWIDGCSSLVEINTVLNQNLAGDNQASIQGKGDNVGTCNINFTAPEPGIFMCIYHANPLVDYNSDNTMVPECIKHFQSDFPIPEFDSIGMQAVYNSDLCLHTTPYAHPEDILGYVPRYIDFKTRVDRTLGDFNHTRKTWVIPVPLRVVTGWATFPDVEHFDSAIYDQPSVLKQEYCRFKVSPSAADNIFFQSPLAFFNSYPSDCLMVDASFGCTKLSNLNVTGLPY